MNHCNSRLIVIILQITEKLPELSYKEHSFIYDRTAGQGYHISIIAALFKYTADNIQSPVKVQAFFHFLRPLNKCLHNARHTVYRSFSQYFRMNRHFTPAQEIQSFFFYNYFKNIFRLISLQLILGKKEHSHTIISFAPQSNAERLTDFAEESVRNLQKNTDAVSGFSFRILSCSVFQVLYNPEGARNSIVTFYAFNIYNCTDSAVIMFKAFPVQSLPAVNFFPHNPCPFFFILSFSTIHDFFSFVNRKNH